jgi:hypothetical protein
MRIPTSIGCAMGTAAATALLAGCSGGASRVAPLSNPGNTVGQQSFARQVSPGLPSRRVRSYMQKVGAFTPLAYISDFSNNFVAVFDRNGTQVGAITSGLVNPEGLFVDKRRNLWVANRFGGNVLEFARGATSPSKTLTDSAGSPADVTICPNGTIYVSNILDTGQQSGSIQVYAHGSTSPTGTLVYSGQGENYFVTCDAAGNVFTTLYLTPNGFVGVVEYKGGNQSGATALPIFLGFPGGIKPNNAGNLLVNDRRAQTVTEYTEAGSATGHSIAYGSSSDWVDIAVTRNGRVILAADDNLLKGTSETFPGGVLRQTYSSNSFSTPLGAAFDPGQMGI